MAIQNLETEVKVILTGEQLLVIRYALDLLLNDDKRQIRDLQKYGDRHRVLEMCLRTRARNNKVKQKIERIVTKKLDMFRDVK